MQATDAATRHFGGFSRESLELLRLLEANNNRPWFAAHQQLFKELLVEPAIDLVGAIGPLLRARLGPDLRAEPRIGGSILRIQYDARYLRERPYRTHLELWFWEGPGPSHQHPGFVVRIGPDRLVVGAGITLFPPDQLLRYREHVDRPESGRELVALLHRLGITGFQPEGSALRRTPRPYPADHQRAGLLKRVGLRLERAETLPHAVPEAVLGPVLPELLVSAFVRLDPLRRWLRRLE